MHNPELICDHGDYLERHWASEIRNRLPAYALIWAKYIGNDGTANYLPMQGASQEVRETRVRLWEHLYTLFESLALCWRLEAKFDQLQAVKSPADYADNLNDWIAFHAHLGRIYDMAEKVAQVFKVENLVAPFDSFYKQRHIVLHYPKVPMRFAENVLATPRIGEKPGDWQKGMRWADLQQKDLKFLAENVKSTLRDLEKVTNKFLYQIFDLAASQKNFVSVQWPEPSGILCQSPLSATLSEIEAESAPPIPLSGVAQMPDNGQ